MNGAQITFFGNLTGEPDELRYTRNTGRPYASAGVAVNTYDPVAQASDVTYYNVTLWGRQAENLINRCRKGQRIFVSGQFRIRNYTRQDGSTGISYDVSAQDFEHFGLNPATQAEPAAKPIQAETAETAVAPVQKEAEPVRTETAAAPVQQKAEPDNAEAKAASSQAANEATAPTAAASVQEPVEPADPF